MIIETGFSMQLKYLPSVGWFVHAMNKKELVLCSTELYRKENHPNRSSIISANGMINLNVPLAGGRNQKARMSELKISGTDWKRNHLHAIKSAYGKAPYFLYYFDELEKIIRLANDNYFELCEALVRWLTKELIPNASVFISNNEIPHISINKFTCNKYYQVFEFKFGFQEDMSAIDLLFNMGPDAKFYLKENKCA